MRSPPSLLLAAATLLLFSASTVNCQDPEKPEWGKIKKYIGCFKTGGSDFKQVAKDVGNSQGFCKQLCLKQKKKYSGMQSKDFCYCGDKLPPEGDIVDNSKCDIGCPGYPMEPCGSLNGHYTIMLANEDGTDPRLYDGSGKTENPNRSAVDTDTPKQTPTTVTKSTEIVIVTQTSTSKPKETKNNNGVNKAGAAAGAVVGVIVAIAIGVGAFIFIRKQKRKKIEEEYRRSAAIREFHKKPDADLRLDPVMLQRRMSSGSIADNQDYSRRILKVTNPE